MQVSLFYILFNEILIIHHRIDLHNDSLYRFALPYRLLIYMAIFLQQCKFYENAYVGDLCDLSYIDQDPLIFHTATATTSCMSMPLKNVFFFYWKSSPMLTAMHDNEATKPQKTLPCTEMRRLTLR